jgi:hypothetical protein
MIANERVPVDDGLIPSDRRARNCLQCGDVLRGDRLLHCDENCRVAWLQSRGLMASIGEHNEQVGRTRRGLVLKGRRRATRTALDDEIRRLEEAR